ncbi:MAG: phosphotransferase [Akkermansiaceae bacterium]|nr:phosphotransferase [Akkermansiaceae bacterium]MDG1364592.1 phosphotransferase [Akkermansiaceae bacterium]
MPPSLSPHFQEKILSATGSSMFEVVEVIQELWSGYGQILRLRLDGDSEVVVKHIRMAATANHPRGWNSDLSHQRKLKSYQVETAWYRHWSERCGPKTRIPELLGFDQHNGEILLILEDLDGSGFSSRLTPNATSDAAIKACIDWLANFHASFMGEEPTHLWKTGTYWHLATRSEELASLGDIELKKAAPTLDQILTNTAHQTLVHGDAKLANFCFSKSGKDVAAVDFQYVGGGCGMKDLAYFIGSCLDESSCEKRESELLDQYFVTLCFNISMNRPDLDPKAIETEWRELYPVAWTDFHRFLKGWSPDHWKINSYSERLTREVVASLQ